MRPAAVEPLPDLGPPREVFARLRTRPGAFLLESADRRHGLGRWSYLGSDPAATLETRGSRTTLRLGGRLAGAWPDPLDAIAATLARYAIAPGDRPDGMGLAAGLVGHLSYDLGRWIERVPSAAADDLRLPELRLDLHDHTLAHDGLTGRWYRASAALDGLDPAARATASDGMLEAARGPAAEPARYEAGPASSRTPRHAYLRAVERALEYVRAGDLYQVNLSHRLELPFHGDPFGLYARLAELHPAPFAAYLTRPGWTLVGASPERFLRLEGDLAEARPIKGTRPRDPDPAVDDERRRELGASEKDRAENLMIVDLLRNDLGRVARPGTVRPAGLFALEAHGPVWQMVSTIRARLRDGCGPADLLRATLPPGSMTGAPKVRALEVIEELEPVRRGPYAGAAGYLDLAGSLDLAVVIRTAVVTAGRAHVQVGGAVVADSDPAAEHEETLAKARGLLEALGPAGARPPG